MTRRSRKAGPQPYDFRRPIKLSREHIRMLQIAYETYARGTATLLTSRLRTLSSVTLLAIEQLTYQEYVETLSSPTMMCAVTLEPLPGISLLEVSLGTGMAFIDHLLGGPGGVQPQRPPPDLEMPLLRGMLDKMLVEFKYAFESLVEVAPALGTIEYNPQFVRTFAPSDAVVVASFEMRVGAEECVATICLPFGTILPVLQSSGDTDSELSPSEADARRISQVNLTAGMESVPLGVSVRFQAVRMRTDDVVDLQVGDIVPLNHPMGRPLAITVNDTTFAYAVPGNQGNRLACLVVPAPKEESRP
jgi:flagellar motor switch protein FliM